MSAIELQVGQRLDWSLPLAARIVARGVVLDDEPLPRRGVLRWVARVSRAWWQWATALPGDTFVAVGRDLLVSVDGGMPKRRTVRVVSGQAIQYRLVRELGLDALFALTPPEPSTFRWHDVQRVRWVA